MLRLPMIKSLTDLNPGDAGIVIGLSGDLPLQSRLVEMGILPGSPIRLVKKAPLNGPLALKVRDYYISVRLDEARSIQVEVE